MLQTQKHENMDLHDASQLLRADDETSRLNAHDDIDSLITIPLTKGINDSLKFFSILKQRGDILKNYPLLREVNDISAECSQIIHAVTP